jgi:hypothetical protein
MGPLAAEPAGEAETLKMAARRRAFRHREWRDRFSWLRFPASRVKPCTIVRIRPSCLRRKL